MHLDGFTLSTPDVAANETYCRDVLGLSDHGIRFVRSAAPYVHRSRDNYWKFSVFVRDIEAAAARVPGATAPAQFGDVGYLAHAEDDAGHKIELIQKSFAQDPLVDDEAPQLGLMTLRTRDPVKSVAEFCALFDLGYVVRMHVERAGGFSLYFLGPRGLVPPSPGVDALENRTWMYGQRALFIELQHRWSDKAVLSVNDEGLVAINASGDLDEARARLERLEIAFTEDDDGLRFETFDRHTVVVSDRL